MSVGRRASVVGRRSTALSLSLTLSLFLSQPAAAWEVNTHHWSAMPIPYWINPAGAPDFGPGWDLERVMQEATGAWSTVPCAAISFVYMGTTDAGLGQQGERDGKNVVYFQSDAWPFTDQAAGATLWFPDQPGQPPEVDLVLNGFQFQWKPGGADAMTQGVVDPVSVVAHELGHWLGFAHSPDHFATMYQALLPSGMQATLAGDDRAGACALYPGGPAGECDTDAQCAADRQCRDIGGVKVCDKRHDPIGAACDKDHLNCADMCFISFFECTTLCYPVRTDYTEGYCAPLCVDVPCPDGWTCVQVPGQAVKVCRMPAGAADGVEAADEAVPDGPAPGEVPDEAATEPAPEAVPEAPDAGADAADDAAPDAGPEAADPGTPAARSGGGGCAGARPGGVPHASLFLLLAAGAIVRGRQNRSSRPAPSPRSR